MAVNKLHSILIILFPLLISTMAAAENDTTRDNVLEWVKTDSRRFLYSAIRVGDLNKTIEFYTECFGMKVLSRKDFPEKKYSIATVGFGQQDSNYVLELIQIQGVEKYDIGTAFNHFGIASEDIYAIAEKVRAFGGVITREPGTMGGGTTVYAFVEDPNGYSFELLQRPPTPEPLCQVCLNVLDLQRAITFYEKAMGMNVLLKYDIPGQFAIAMVGYGANESQTAVIELKYNYNVTGYTEGDGYIKLAIGTDDVYKSAAAVKLVSEEVGGHIVYPPGPMPGTDTKITSFLDPDYFKTVLADNEDYLKEIHKEE
jgi:lactoylglutathione lyase